jgi:GNAT superfamily N-acetyltransferase
LAAVEVTLRSAAEDEELFGLYGLAFGPAAAAASRERWHWQYEDNPAFAKSGPIVWMAREGTRPLGQMATMRVSLLWGGREVQASWGTDYFVREEARGRGLGALLLETWSAHEELTMAVGVTPFSYPVFEKVGFRFVGSVPLFQKVLDPWAVAHRRLGRPLGHLAAPFLAAGLRLVLGSEPMPPRDVEVRKVAGFGPEYDALWERARDAYSMCVRRDGAYLSWKYGRSPRRYDIREARRGGILAGFVVSREEDLRGIRLGWIVDLFCEAGDSPVRDALLGTVLASMRTSGVGRVQAFALHGGLARDLRRHGFFLGVSTARLCVKSGVDPRGAFENLPGWHVTFGDSDLDR